MKAGQADKDGVVKYPKEWHEYIDPKSLEYVKTAVVEPQAVKDAQADVKSGRAAKLDVSPRTYQFTRLGFYCTDKDSTPEKLVFNLTVPLKEDKSKGK